MIKLLKYFVIIIVVISIVFFIFFFMGKTKQAKKIIWGVNFSQKQAQNLGLDWKKTYLDILDDLKVKNIRISAHWDLVEKEEGKYSFDDLDWQIKEAEKRGADIILAVGMKTPRWPECHIPEWVKNKEASDRNQKLFDYVKTIVERYKNSPAISVWQVENETFFPFGNCPKPDENLLKEEISIVKKSSQNGQKVLISDSGEGSFWIRSARLGDVVGISMYRKVWFGEWKSYVKYPFPPIFYQKKAWLVKKLFGKDVICTELQAEPWAPKNLQDLSEAEAGETMDLKKFKESVEFAKKTGLDKFYFWGAEWWEYLKTIRGDSDIWNEARSLFKN